MREAFEDAIEQNPYDVTTRHVFGDWLDENTDKAELAAFHRSASVEKVKMGESYLKDFAARHGGDFDDLVKGLRRHAKDCFLYFSFGDDLGFDAQDEMKDAKEAAILWRMFREYTGFYHMPPCEADGADNPFSCCY